MQLLPYIIFPAQAAGGAEEAVAQQARAELSVPEPGPGRLLRPGYLEGTDGGHPIRVARCRRAQVSKYD